MALEPYFAPFFHRCIIRPLPADCVGHVLEAPQDAEDFPSRSTIISGSSVKEIFIRPCYDRIFRQVLYGVMEEPKSAQRGVLVTGNPGIGKSYFLVFLLWRILMGVSGNAAQIAALNYQPYPDKHEISSKINNIIYASGHFLLHWRVDRVDGIFHQLSFLPLPKESYKSWGMLKQERMFEDSSTWVLWDCISETKAAPSKQCTGRAVVVVAAAPDRKAHFHEFRHNLNLRVTMTIWDEAEMFSAYSALHRHELPLSAVEERFSRFGGIPRNVFTCSNFPQAEQYERSAVNNSIGGNWMETILSGLAENDPIVHHEFLGRVANPKMIFSTTAPAVEDPSMQEDVRIIFLNPTAEEFTMKILESREPLCLVRWLRENPEIPTMATPRRWLFERFMQRTLANLPWPNAGPEDWKARSFLVEWLGRGGLSIKENPVSNLTDDEKIHQQRTQLLQEEVFPDLENNENLRPELSEIPISSSFSLLDGLAKPRFLFQFSVGNEEIVKPGLKKFLNGLGLDGSRGHGDSLDSAPLLFFVVPQSRFATFSLPTSSWLLIPRHVQVFKLRSNDLNDNAFQAECIEESNRILRKAHANSSLILTHPIETRGTSFSGGGSTSSPSESKPKNKKRK